MYRCVDMGKFFTSWRNRPFIVLFVSLSFVAFICWYVLSSSILTGDKAIFDVHLARGDDAKHHRSAKTADEGDNKLTIAIGGGITSRGVADVTEQSDLVAKFVFFSTFLPTFCSTACANFTYRFYFAFNFNDAVFANPQLAVKFQRTFDSQTTMLCLRPRGVVTSLNLVEVSYEGTPARAQNDAMMEAYLDHVDYFYRINDDTQMITGGWASSFVRVLDGYDPPRVGVVGPNHSGGNTGILTYEFVHRTHVDVFGFYYPRCFTDWWADNWITGVYQPNRSTKIQHVRLRHTLALGQRYHVLKDRGEELLREWANGRLALNRYIAAVRARNANLEPSTMSDGRRIIAMTLYGRLPTHTWGVVRNAQLVRVHFPKWRLRVYVPSTSLVVPEMTVPPRVIRKLRLLGAEIAYVSGKFGNTTHASYPPRDWRLLVADDQNVDYFLVRDAESRLSDREASAIDEWIREVEWRASVGMSDSFAVHCIRDRPSHADRAIVDGLWGGRPRVLRRRLGTRLTTALYRKLTNSTDNQVNSTDQRLGPKTPVEEALWPLVVGDRATALFHDVVSPCGRWTTTSKLTIRRPFPVARRGRHYIGQRYNEHEELADGESSESEPPKVVMC